LEGKLMLFDFSDSNQLLVWRKGIYPF